MAGGFKIGVNIKNIKEWQKRHSFLGKVSRGIHIIFNKPNITFLINTLIFVSIIRFFYVLPVTLYSTAGSNKISLEKAIVQRYSEPVPSISKITTNVKKLSSIITIPLQKHTNWVNGYPFPKMLDSALGGIENLTGLRRIIGVIVYIVVAILGFIYQILFLLFSLVVGILGMILEFILIKAWWLFNAIGVFMDSVFPKIPVFLVWLGLFSISKLLTYIEIKGLRRTLELVFYGGLIWFYFYGASLPNSIGISLNSIYK